jgi:hypothetical protein
MTQTPTESDFLTVQVAGEGCEPERLLLISRPVDGRVQVREWATGSWNAEPLEREVGVEELFDAFQRAANARRKISQELYYIRTWLDGIAP